MIYVTSDHHFGHENIIKHCQRPFRDADEMDQFMVDAWNSVVTDNDDVYHLGDFSHKRCPVERANAIARQLRGRVRLLVGNHETDSEEAPRNSPLDFEHYLSLIKLDLSLFEEVNPGYHEMYIERRLVVMSHYAQQSWHDMRHKEIPAIHLHGHSHGKLKPLTRRLDVGVDTHDFKPWAWDQILARLKLGPARAAVMEQKDLF